MFKSELKTVDGKLKNPLAYLTKRNNMIHVPRGYPVKWGRHTELDTLIDYLYHSDNVYKYKIHREAVKEAGLYFGFIRFLVKAAYYSIKGLF